MIIRNGQVIAETTTVTKQVSGSDTELLTDFANFLLGEYEIQQLYNGNYLIN